MPIFTSVPFGLSQDIVHPTLTWDLEGCFTLCTSFPRNINDRYDWLIPLASLYFLAREELLRGVFSQTAVRGFPQKANPVFAGRLKPGSGNSRF